MNASIQLLESCNQKLGRPIDERSFDKEGRKADTTIATELVDGQMDQKFNRLLDDSRKKKDDAIARIASHPPSSS